MIVLPVYLPLFVAVRVYSRDHFVEFEVLGAGGIDLSLVASAVKVADEYKFVVCAGRVDEFVLSDFLETGGWFVGRMFMLEIWVRSVEDCWADDRQFFQYLHLFYLLLIKKYLLMKTIGQIWLVRSINKSAGI